MLQVMIEDVRCGDVLKGTHVDHEVLCVEKGRTRVYLYTRMGGNTTVLARVTKGKTVTVIKRQTIA